MGKIQEYIERSEQARKDIATWPQWMQNNLTPPREEIFSRRDMDIAWAAGFFDGEGSVSIINRESRKNNNYYQIVIGISQINKDPLSKIQGLFGGSIRRPDKTYGPRRPFFVWKAYSNEAESAIATLLPHLVVKKYDVEIALEFRKLVKSNNGKRVTEEVHQKRKSYYDLLKAHHTDYIWEEGDSNR